METAEVLPFQISCMFVILNILPWPSCLSPKVWLSDCQTRHEEHTRNAFYVNL